MIRVTINGKDIFIDEASIGLPFLEALARIRPCFYDYQQRGWIAIEDQEEVVEVHFGTKEVFEPKKEPEPEEPAPPPPQCTETILIAGGETRRCGFSAGHDGEHWYGTDNPVALPPAEPAPTTGVPVFVPAFCQYAENGKDCVRFAGHEGDHELVDLSTRRPRCLTGSAAGTCHLPLGHTEDHKFDSPDDDIPF